MTKPDLKLERVLVPPVGKEVKPLAECVSRLQEEVDRWTRNVELADPVDLTSILDRLDAIEARLDGIDEDLVEIFGRLSNLEYRPFNDSNVGEYGYLKDVALTNGTNDIRHHFTTDIPNRYIVYNIRCLDGSVTYYQYQVPGATYLHFVFSRVCTADFFVWHEDA